MSIREAGYVLLVKGKEATAKFWMIKVKSGDYFALVIGDVFPEFGKVDEGDAVDRRLNGAAGCVIAGLLTLRAHVIEVAVVARSRDGVIPFR